MKIRNIFVGLLIVTACVYASPTNGIDPFLLTPQAFQPVLFREYRPWKVAATLISSNAEQAITGTMEFLQAYPGDNNAIVKLNATGLPAGKHGVHIHEFGDLSESCKSTGSHFKRHLIGNIDVKEDGSILITFQTPYINVFGPEGIVGRAVVIHEKPIQYSTFPDIYNPVDAAAKAQGSEEEQVGGGIACGIVSIADAKDM